ncbi:EpsG family protein [Acinetobacter indicus]|uniref:EpsG family protein n=1 Tax=Acinetobacter indicus TaxID=756892 RepID=A0AAW8YZT7_9GAMM|nr:EpsG family protein [Acinetobacter indicus]MDV4314275.1 EpsG family protein [Acinetobacter indicus]
MSLVFIAYMVMCFFGIFFCFFEIKKIVGYVVFFVLFTVFSIIARNSELKVDMVNYFQILSYDWDSYLTNFYYLKEPVYWLSSKFLFSIVNNELLVFILIDVISMALFLYFCYKNQVSNYFVFLFFCFFVSIMGFQNIYRQYLATFLIFSSVFLIKDKGDLSFFKKNVVMVISILTHNVSALFYPLIYLRLGKKNLTYFFIVTCFVFYFLWKFLDTKSSSETGEVGVGVFLGFLIFLFFIYSLINKFRFYGEELINFLKFIYLIVLSLFCLSLLGQAQFKRVIMIALVLSIYMIYKAIELKFKKNDKILIRLTFFIVLVIPCFIFNSVKNFLMVQ